MFPQRIAKAGRATPMAPAQIVPATIRNISKEVANLNSWKKPT